ncbi:protein C3orf33 homolog isoform X2 [Lampris incognitus]|uniref:protein C3orf33 homolog isoform X2 n=1 Tax=Lampris incognitus TaxID=2546036 RepID=UPI0024B5183B|nr:protein C3orf33 homolog isoform X2 [Lampris incognitus]
MPGGQANGGEVVEEERDARNPARDFVTLVSRLADDNLMVVRNLSTGVAVLGVIAIARSIRLVTKFGAVSEIPAHFIEKNVSLRGRIRKITENGLEAEHIPIYVPVLSPLLSRRARTSSLAVHLAGVELTPEGRMWLGKQLAPTQTVWLKLISREENILHCLVSHSKGSVWRYSVNEEALRLGLARTVPICGLPPGSRPYWRLHKRLAQAEFKAEKKGRGLWKEDSVWERASRSIRDNALFRILRRLFKRAKATK